MYIDFCNIKRAVKYKTIKGCETENDNLSKNSTAPIYQLC